jgi:hypothetical protein
MDEKLLNGSVQTMTFRDRSTPAGLPRIPDGDNLLRVRVPSFGRRVVCAKCGSGGNHIDVRPNWKEQPT